MADVVPSDKVVDAAAVQLERHERRRSAGIPSVTVLAGGREREVRRWEDWAGRRAGRPIRIELPKTEPIAEACLDALLGRRDVVRDALSALGRRTGRTADELRSEWSCRTGQEKRLWLDRLGLKDGPDDLDRFCRGLLELAAAVPRREISIRVGREAIRRQLRWDAPRTIATLCRLLPPRELPALLFVWRDASADRFGFAAEELHALAGVAPALPIALAVEAEVLENWLHGGRETRARRSCARASSTRRQMSAQHTPASLPGRPLPSDRPIHPERYARLPVRRNPPGRGRPVLSRVQIGGRNRRPLPFPRP